LGPGGYSLFSCFFFPFLFIFQNRNPWVANLFFNETFFKIGLLLGCNCNALSLWRKKTFISYVLFLAFKNVLQKNCSILVFSILLRPKSDVNKIVLGYDNLVLFCNILKYSNQQYKILLDGLVTMIMVYMCIVKIIQQIYICFFVCSFALGLFELFFPMTHVLAIHVYCHCLAVYIPKILLLYYLYPIENG
jgi:hypothetical protein